MLHQTTKALLFDSSLVTRIMRADILVSLCLVACFNALNCQSVWPEPQQRITNGDVYIIDSNRFDFVQREYSASGCDIVDQAMYRSIIFQRSCPDWSWPQTHKNEKIRSRSYQRNGSIKQLYNISIYYRNCDLFPAQYMDEMYTLSIGSVARSLGLDENESSTLPTGEGTLIANSAWGVLRGLETFSQLIYQSQETDKVVINGTFILDYPRFTYRSILLDTARHFIPVPVLKQNLDAMMYNKMNVFHWHIVDDQSFPYESMNFPSLHRKGSYAKTHVYSQADIADIIEYARVRGIRVIPEFDSPGHTLSWGKGQPDLLSKCYSEEGKPTGDQGPIDPSKETSYSFLYNLMAEVAGVFPDRFIHLGGDEVDFKCWINNPGILQFMLQQNISQIEKLEEYYMNRLVKIVGGLNKSYIVWQEVLDNNVTLKSDTLINVWKWFGTSWQEEMAKVTKAGFQTIIYAPWYLNYIHYGPDWHTFYQADPTNFTGTDMQKKLVVGGGACMWSEYVDGSEMTPRLWPRASAVAERLWSSKDVQDVATARSRIKHHQCLLQKRGLRVEPVDGPGFCECDYTYV